MKIFTKLKARTLLINCLLLIPLLISTGAQAGKFYKWVDEEGVTHYTETPPENSQSTVIKTQGKTPKNADHANSRLEATRKSLEEAIDKRKEKKEAGKLDVENAKVKQKNCETAKNNLKILLEHGRIKEKGEDGEYKMLADEKRQERIQKARDRIKEFCY